MLYVCFLDQYRTGRVYVAIFHLIELFKYLLILFIVLVVRVIVARRLVLALDVSKSVSNSAAKRLSWVVVARALLIDVLSHEIDKMQNPERTEERIARDCEHKIHWEFLRNR